jgi:predicted Rossmann fold nucleotide-binding protein DprA/Smf involved in DNA uptake
MEWLLLKLERMGTLITVRLAMEQNRDVMVVPEFTLSSQYQGSRADKEGPLW